MYYELYVDVLFLVNFFMDYLLLLFVWRILRCDTGHLRVVAGAGLGAFLSCILIILPIPNAFLEFVSFHLIVNTCMIQVGLKTKSIPIFMKALIILYIGAFFMGGIMESLQQYVKIGGIFLLLAIVGYYLALAMWKFLSKLQRWNSKYVTVELLYRDKKVKVRGLLDTGNGLYDPITGKPVSVLGGNSAKMLALNEEDGIRYISYKSVGRKDGVLPIVCLDKMCVKGEETHCFDKPLIGIADEAFLGNEDFQMILSPNLF